MSDKELRRKMRDCLNGMPIALHTDNDADTAIALVRKYCGYKDPTMVSMGTAHEADIRADERQRCVERACAAIESIKEDESYDKGFVNDVAASHNASLSDAQLALLAEFTDK